MVHKSTGSYSLGLGMLCRASKKRQVHSNLMNTIPVFMLVQVPSHQLQLHSAAVVTGGCLTFQSGHADPSACCPASSHAAAAKAAPLA